MQEEQITHGQHTACQPHSPGRVFTAILLLSP